MRKTKLPKGEIEICGRLRDARNKLGITIEECAREIGVARTTLINYELAKTPVRSELALRFCRQMIVSEEWLATGRFDHMERAGRERGSKPGSQGTEMDEIYFRQCLDLFSEPASRHSPARELFSEAWPRHLSALYSRLAGPNYHLPRIAFNDMDVPRLVTRFLTMIFSRWLLLIAEVAKAQRADPVFAQRLFSRLLFESGYALFRDAMSDLTDTRPVGEVEGSSQADGVNRKDNRLTGITENSKSPAVKSEMTRLLEVVRMLTAATGRKVLLASELGVEPARISEWLAGKYQPNGETTLRLLHWVAREKVQQNSPASIITAGKAKAQRGRKYEQPNTSGPAV